MQKGGGGFKGLQAFKHDCKLGNHAVITLNIVMLLKMAAVLFAVQWQSKAEGTEWR